MGSAGIWSLSLCQNRMYYHQAELLRLRFSTSVAMPPHLKLLPISAILLGYAYNFSTSLLARILLVDISYLSCKREGHTKAVRELWKRWAWRGRSLLRTCSSRTPGLVRRWATPFCLLCPPSSRLSLKACSWDLAPAKWVSWFMLSVPSFWSLPYFFTLCYTWCNFRSSGSCYCLM